MKYQQRIFTYFFLLFVGFTLVVSLLQFKRESEYKTNILKENLDTYANFIDKYIDENNLSNIENILSSLPENLRLTIVNNNGVVLFDNTIDKTDILENHLHRPEISNSRINNYGSAIRFSDTKKIDYYYYSKYFEPIFIRVALPNDTELKSKLKADKYFIYFIIFLVIVALIVILFISNRLGRSVSSLKDFLTAIENNNLDLNKIKFPSTEIGEIGQKISDTYLLLEDRNKELDQEREKILHHFHYLEEGIAIYDINRKCIYANAHFMRNINIISNEPTLKAVDIFKMPEFNNMISFLSTKLKTEYKDTYLWQGKISKAGNHFSLKLVIYQDYTFEVSLNNISNEEKTRLLKTEMTNNIAHELRTPVSSIKGYIETLINADNLDEERKKHYLNRTYMQVNRLSDLIRDISLITKAEQSPNLSEKENVDIKNILEEIEQDFSSQIKENNINMNLNIGDDIIIKGNKTLIYAIFSNLIDNSIKYAGENININIDNYSSDNDFYYFKFSDSGSGIDEVHLNKIFDRFYRVNQGRSRKSGGSGLGLSIVKNAIKFHSGEIAAKLSVKGSLEFIFSLNKDV